MAALVHGIGPTFELSPNIVLGFGFAYAALRQNRAYKAPIRV